MTDEKAPPSNPELKPCPAPVPYPRYFQAIVGVAPDKLKYFTVDDVKTLIECFKTATGVDPLETREPLAKVFKDTCGPTGYLA